MAAMENKSVEAQNASQFNKTKMCKFFRIGKCAKGTQCPFAHHTLELRQQPDLRCTKFCKELLEAGVCRNTSCTFAHSKEELRSRGALHKTKLCRNMQAGCCSFGRDCNFAHSKAELCVPDTTMTLPPGFSPPELCVPGGDDEYELPWTLMPSSWNGDKENSWSGAGSNAGSAVSTDDIASTTDSEKVPSLSPSTYSSESIGSLASNTYGSTLGEPAYVISNLASEFQCDKFAPYMLGDYQVGATLFDTNLDSTLGFGFDWGSLADSLVVNQKNGMNISSVSASANLTKSSLRAVRTSESTLCTLSSSPRN